MKDYKLKINGNDYEVSIDAKRDEPINEVIVNGTAYQVEIVDGEIKRVTKTAKPQVTAIPATHPVKPSAVEVGHPAGKAQTSVSNGSESPIKSPLPGVILDVKVKEGETIKVGQTLVILEAMKMENNIDSDKAGVVKSIKVNRGDSVLEGDVLITLG